MKKFAGDIINLHVYPKSQLYDVWFLRYRDRQNFLSFWAIFCPLSPLTTQKVKILKLKKTPGDIIILHICTINDNHVMYGSWDMERDGQNFLSFWTVSFSFTPPTNPKMFEKLKKKNTWRYYHFTQVYQKSWSYALLFLRYGV